jgi:hypothetical protein
MAAKTAFLLASCQSRVSEDWMVGAPELPEANEIKGCDSETAAQNPAKTPAIPKGCRTFATVFQPYAERDEGMFAGRFFALAVANKEAPHASTV